MERIDSIHSSSSSTDGTPKPILISSHHHPHHPHHHSQRRSISGIDILNGLKIMSSGNSHNDTPPSPVPTSQLISEHHFSQMDDFDIKEAIGYGSSAIVYKAIYKPFNKAMALKMIDLDKFERNQIDELRRETALMALSKHTNVLRVCGSFVYGSKLYIVTPFLAGGSCLDIMKTRFPDGLDESSIATILKQALEGLTYLHKNGHIHRDVKAGNLLMDQDGTVLLGDFGVSSSLMETGERGMRKTFVGTPCWMAPEVMEQAEYDYKADIWSFGITAIELATGHAPFAKYPPLKVLMMTLSSDPPTLDRDGNIHKYSKSFKEMIDICLSKDPLKRPTAEKLLSHSFFKQAKRKEHLIKTILLELPPLEQRPRKKIPQKQVTITRTDEWDFDDDTSEEDDDDEDGNSIIVQQDQQQQENSTKKTTTITTTKRHISFGDVVVRSMTLPSSPPPTTTSSSSSSSTPPVGTPPRKSRFVIEETTTSTAESSPMLLLEEDSAEVIKGRFYVNQTTKPVNDSQDDVQHQQIHKIPSQDMLNNSISTDRKSRFEVSSMMYQPIPLSRDGSSYSTSSMVAVPAYTGNTAGYTAANAPTTTTNRNTTAIVEKRYPIDTTTLTTENIALLTESSRKIGRFELTGGSTSTTSSSVDVTPRGSISHHPHSSPAFLYNINPQYQIEELLRFNESQKLILQELNLILKKNDDSSSSSYFDAATVNNNSTNTVEHLDKLIQSTLYQNSLLQKENESLRRELKELKSNNNSHLLQQ